MLALDLAVTGAWAREAKAAFEIVPLVELQKGERVQLGFELDLYARIPEGLAAPDAVVEPLWDRLRDIAESFLPLLGAEGRIEIEPFDRADRLRPETRFAPEVLLQARVFHGADYLKGVAADERAQLRPIEERLVELGLRPRSW